MPPPLKQNETTRIQGWVGVDLDRDPLLLEPTFLQAGIGIDLHVEPGSIVSSAGYSPIYNHTEQVNIIRIISGMYYSMTLNNIFRDGVSQGLIDPSPRKSIVSFQPLNGIDSEIYFATDAEMFRESDSSLVSWGIAARGPAPDLSASSGEMTGTVGVVYTYARKVGSSIVSESNASGAASITLTDQKVSASVVASTDPQVTHIRIYRTQVGGTAYLFDTEVLNTTQAVTLRENDLDLGGEVESDHDRPPVSGMVVSHANRLFAAVGNKLFYSQRFEPEYWPALNFIEIGGPTEEIVALVSTGGQLGVFTKDTKYRVVEQVAGVSAIGQDLPFFGGTNNTFFAIEARSRRGTDSFKSIVDTPFGIAYVSRDGVFLTDLNTDTKISTGIQKLFLGNSTAHGSVDTSDLSSSACGFFKDKLYVSLSNATAIYSFDSRAWVFVPTIYTSYYFDEPTDNFWTGQPNGFVDIIERPEENPGGTFTVQTADIDSGSRYLSKLFLYINIDYEMASGESINLDLIVDEVIKASYTLSGDRGKDFLRVPAGVVGKVFSLKFSGSYTRRFKIFGADIIWKRRSEI